MDVDEIMFQYIYTACGGTSKGIALKELLCGLVLITRGCEEEKIRCKSFYTVFVLLSFCLSTKVVLRVILFHSSFFVQFPP